MQPEKESNETSVTTNRMFATRISHDLHRLKPSGQLAQATTNDNNSV